MKLGIVEWLGIGTSMTASTVSLVAYVYSNFSTKEDLTKLQNLHVVERSEVIQRLDRIEDRIGELDRFLREHNK